ncbi:MAG: DUF1841 family protein [Deltaproteobacteria bacterium]|nr:DUF1841 family protein [Deltaproteobacteria bacterium]
MRSGLSSKADSPNLNIIDSAFEAFRQANRQHLHHIWRRAQSGHLDGLREEETRLAEVMLAHSDEYFNQFEFADVLADREFHPESEVNPFMHVALHALLEKQVKDRVPIEALQLYNAMLRNGCTAHEAIHLLMGILLKFLFPILTKRGRFDLDGYRKLLRVYKTQKPDKIIASFNSEPDSTDTEEVDDKKFQVFDEMRSAMKEQTFKSIEKAQAFADAWLREKNAEPKSEFFGLSPEQMHRLLYRVFEDTSDIVALNRDLLSDKILEISIVKEAVYFLRRLGELQPLKATAKGNLPRAFAREIHNRFPENPVFPFRISSEEDDMKLSSLRHILDMCGWIKKRNQKFYLTRKGKILNEKGFGPGDFHHLFKTYTRKYNWASRDFYPELQIIQQAFLFSCYILHMKGKTGASTNELSTYFMQTFPAVIKTEGRGLSSEEFLEIAQHSFYVRFIERFCEYFGLVTIQKREKRFLQLDYLIKTTPFFDELFQWE